MSKSFKRDKSRGQEINRKFQESRKKVKGNANQKTQSNIFSFNFSVLVSIRVGKKTALVSALPTHCKPSTETVSVSYIVIGEGTFSCIKVDHLNSLDMQCAVKEGKE